MAITRGLLGKNNMAILETVFVRCYTQGWFDREGRETPAFLLLSPIKIGGYTGGPRYEERLFNSLDPVSG